LIPYSFGHNPGAGAIGFELRLRVGLMVEGYADIIGVLVNVGDAVVGETVGAAVQVLHCEPSGQYWQAPQ
jgi:hypothetical protein